jgi:hypothetical protein
MTGEIGIKISARDRSSLVGSDTFKLTITPVNDAPIVSAAIVNQTVAEDANWPFQVPAGTFTDVDNASMTYSASLASGSALSGWLTFNAVTRTFTGTPLQDFNGSLDLKVTASDGFLSASNTFKVTVTPVNDAPVVATPIPDQSMTEDGTWTYQVPAGTFTDVTTPS